MDKLSELQIEAKEDLIILDDEDLHKQSYKNQIIKPKWLDYKSKYKLMMFQCKGEHKRLYREKWEYYGGKADAKVYVAKPFDLKVLKTDLQMYINSDDEILELQVKDLHIYNILASLAVLKEFGLDLKKTIKVFKNFQPSEGRGRIHKILSLIHI